MAESRLLAVLAVAGLAFLLVLASRDVVPPRPRPADAPPEVFSADRAMEIVEALAAAPRPPGSAAHAAARAEIVRRLRSLGLEPSERTATLAIGAAGLDVATVTNVVARIEGADPTDDAIALMAHYDTVAPSPGAGDDASGVATVLEAARALLAGERPRCDVLLLLTDGEERGLLGARAFVERDPDAADVRVALNFEARGHRGPSILFETGAGSRALLEAYAGVDRPCANSVAYEIYRRMPNDTDLSVMKAAGITGANFGFLGGVSHYHAALDRPEALDRGSLQQHGDAAVAMARALGERSLSDVATSGEACYFTSLGLLFGYPIGMALPVAILAAAALGLALATGFRRGWTRSRSLRIGVLFVPVAGALAVIAALTVTALVEDAAADSAVLASQVVYDQGAYLAGVALLSFSVATFVLLQLRARAKIEGLHAGSLLVWAVAALVAAATVPGGSWLFAWPLLGASLALLLLLRRPRRLEVTAGRGLGAIVLCAPVVLLAAPQLWLLGQSLGLGAAWILALAVVFAVGALTPVLMFAMAHRRLLLPVASGATGFAVIAWTVLHGEASAARPIGDSIAYLVDLDAGEAAFSPVGRPASAWSETLFLGAEVAPIARFDPRRDGEALLVDAPFTPVPGPAIAVDGIEWFEVPADPEGAAPRDAEGAAPRDAEARRGRRYRVSIDVPAGTSELFLRCAGALEGGIVEVADPDRAEPMAVRGPWFRWRAPPARVAVVVEAGHAGPLSLGAYAVRADLPDLGVLGVPARPPYVMPRRHAGDATVVGRQVTLDVRGP